MKWKLLTILFVISGLFIAGCGDHEHPGDKEHPDGESAANISKDELADAVEKYVEDAAKKTDGHFIAIDPTNKETLKPTLDKVHRERLSFVGNDTYFACADFKATNGKTYDGMPFDKVESKFSFEQIYG